MEKKLKAEADDDLEVLLEEPDDLEIEVADDTPEGDKGKAVASLTTEGTEDVEDPPSEEEMKSYSSKVQDRIKRLTAKYHQERRAKEAAARQIDELAKTSKYYIEESNKLKTLVNKGEGFWKDTNKSKIDSQIQQANKELKDAFEAGDSDKLVEAQGKIAKLTVELDRTLSWNPEPLRPTPVPTAAPAQPAPPPVDQKAVTWRSRNEWFGEDTAMTAFALGLHQDLVNNGADPTSNSYYKIIDGELQKRFPEKFKKTGRATSVVASASRTNGGKNPRSVTLTTSQIAIAKKLGVSPKQYAEEILRMQSNG